MTGAGPTSQGKVQSPQMASGTVIAQMLLCRKTSLKKLKSIRVSYLKFTEGEVSINRELRMILDIFK